MMTIPSPVVIVVVLVIIALVGAVFYFEKQYEDAVKSLNRNSAMKPLEENNEEPEFLGRLSEYVTDASKLDEAYRDCVKRLEEEYQDKKNKLKQFAEK